MESKIANEIGIFLTIFHIVNGLFILCCIVYTLSTFTSSNDVLAFNRKIFGTGVRKLKEAEGDKPEIITAFANTWTFFTLHLIVLVVKKVAAIYIKRKYKGKESN